MAALSGAKTLAELSWEYSVLPTMINTWKQQLLPGMQQVIKLIVTRLRQQDLPQVRIIFRGDSRFCRYIR